MAKTNSLKVAPYYKNTGHLAEWAASYSEHLYDWQPNEPFEVNRMDIVSMERGQSAARFILEDMSTGIRYPMFMSSMLALVKGASILFGEVWDAQWIVVKKGANYGIELYGGVK